MKREILIDGESHVISSDDDYLKNMEIDFEPYMIDLFKSFISHEDVVLDIGANIGLTAILFSKLASKVYSFEPSPSTFEILKENITRAGLNNVKAVNLGLGDENKTMTITFSNTNRSGGFVSNKIQPKEGHITEQIKIETLDDYLTGNTDEINFIKIDVEGFEATVLKGAKTTLEKYMPTVVLELNHFCLNALHRITVPDFFDFLQSIFPCLYAVDSDNSSYMNLRDETQAYHVMYEHIINFRYPNIVAGSDISSIEKKLVKLKKNKHNTILLSLKNKFKQKSVSSEDELDLTPEITDARGRLKVISPPPIVRRSEVFFLDVEIINESENPWITSGSKPVYLSYHWQDSIGETVVFDGERTSIECDEIVPRQSIHSRVKVVPPANSDQFNLLVTIVQEGVAWFEDRGLKHAEVKISVVE